MTLNERSGLILKAVVEEYVRSGIPVASGAIVRRYGLRVSPATVRNELARLEETGYVTQPHTSAGRQPSDLGYRFYVDHLMSPSGLSVGEEGLVREYLDACGRGVRHAVRAVARFLGEVTSYVALVLAPDLGPGRLAQVRLLPLPGDQALLVVLLDGGGVRHTLLDVPAGIESRDLEVLSAELDSAFSGRTVEDLPGVVAELWRSSLARYGAMLDRATSALLDTLAVGEQGGERVYLGGTANVLRLPEFQDVERLRQVLVLLERDASLLRLLEERIGQTGVRVTIGSENGAPEMRGCSLATTTYRAARGGTGLLGLLGPTRMDYRRVTTLLDVVRRQLDGLLDG